MKCPTCKGTKIQTVSVTEWGKPSTSFETACVLCNGTGKTTKKYVDASKNFWCECQSAPDNWTYVADRTAVKHHWVCDKCGKTTQIG